LPHFTSFTRSPRQADVVVLNLGTNDFVFVDPTEADFEKAGTSEAAWRSEDYIIYICVYIYVCMYI
jgi:hypothetical protein